MNKIEQLKNDSEFRENVALMKKLANLKNREVLRESLNEMKR